MLRVDHKPHRCDGAAGMVKADRHAVLSEFPLCAEPCAQRKGGLPPHVGLAECAAALLGQAYTEYDPDYRIFYARALADLEAAQQTRAYGLDAEHHPNWFDASCVPWLSYDALHLELPDGYLYFSPIVNWGAYREENGRFMMPVTVRLNHAAADGYQIARVFRLIAEEICALCGE